MQFHIPRNETEPFGYNDIPKEVLGKERNLVNIGKKDRLIKKIMNYFLGRKNGTYCLSFIVCCQQKGN